jgi:uncharacterized protein YggE
MRNLKTVAYLTILSAISVSALAQISRGDQKSRKITVTATQTIQVDPEIAVLKVGFTVFGSTEESAYKTAAQRSGQIIAAILRSGIARDAVESDEQEVSRTEFNRNEPKTLRIQRQFSVSQSWKVKTPVGKISAVLAAAVQAGADSTGSADWTVTDPIALEAKASGKALARARVIAQEMAAGLGVKLGELIYASNRDQVGPLYLRGAGDSSLETATAEVSAAPIVPPPPMLAILPKKVERTATVYAEFAIE